MKLEAGKTYIRRDGVRVKIMGKDSFPFIAATGWRYSENGQHGGSDSGADWDLISEAPPEFKVGQKWRLRNGQVRTLRSVSEPYAATITTEEGGGRWWPDGKFSHNGESELDLIELVSEPEEKPEPKPARKIVWITGDSTVTALCDDGSVWEAQRVWKEGPEYKWRQLPAIPQDAP